MEGPDVPPVAPEPTPAHDACLLSGGEMGARMPSFDWSTTPLGPVEGWPQSLKTAVQILLNSRYPMFVWWGQKFTNLYNDAYAPILGRRHPQALGQSAPVIWADVWDVVGPQADAVLYEGRSSWNEELLRIMERYGYPEETYFTFSYSPITNDTGGVGGVFCAVTEDTTRVLGQRRPDLVLTDIMMPELDGLGLLQQIRATSDIRQLPVILLSARVGEDASIEGLQAGADDYLIKPFSARELVARVRTHIDMARVRRQAAEEIARQREDLYGFIMQSPVPMCILRGPELVYEMANAAYVSVAAGRDVLGKPLLDILPEFRGQGYDGLLRDVMRTGEPGRGQRGAAHAGAGRPSPGDLLDLHLRPIARS